MPLGRTRSSGRAAPASCDALEPRVLFSTINWTNKGTSASDTDGFNAVFASFGDRAREIVQRAVDDWERVIVNNSCPKGLVEDANEMRVVKAEMERKKNAYPNVADRVRNEAFRRNIVAPAT